jgi:parvulin-like peptidyl-prolyl isomerase
VASARAEGHGPEIASSLGGDPFVMGAAMDAQSRGDLIKFFGPAFADSVLALPEGRWSAPVESSFGWHVVYVTKQFGPRIPELAEVRSRVLNTWQNQRRSEHVEEFLAKVRPRYEVRIDEDAIREASRG